jgi:Fe2+ transport system protein FeoA
MNLSECKEGDTVRVVRLAGGGNLRKRLLEMGLVGGAELRVVKYAPLRDPLELVVGEAHLSLRVAEAALVAVQTMRPAGETFDGS